MPPSSFNTQLLRAIVRVVFWRGFFMDLLHKAFSRSDARRDAWQSPPSRRAIPRSARTWTSRRPPFFPQPYRTPIFSRLCWQTTFSEAGSFPLDQAKLSGNTERLVRSSPFPLSILHFEPCSSLLPLLVVRPLLKVSPLKLFIGVLFFSRAP